MRPILFDLNERSKQFLALYIVGIFLQSLLAFAYNYSLGSLFDGLSTEDSDLFSEGLITYALVALASALLVPFSEYLRNMFSLNALESFCSYFSSKKDFNTISQRGDRIADDLQFLYYQGSYFLGQALKHLSELFYFLFFMISQMHSHPDLKERMIYLFTLMFFLNILTLFFTFFQIKGLRFQHFRFESYWVRLRKNLSKKNFTSTFEKDWPKARKLSLLKFFFESISQSLSQLLISTHYFLPLLILAPGVLEKSLTLGLYMRLASATQSVQASITFFSSQHKEISRLASAYSRIKILEFEQIP